MIPSYYIESTLIKSAIVRRFARNGNVMWMAFEHTCIGDTYELCIVQTINTCSTAIAHS